MKTISYVVMIIMTATMALAISCDMRDDAEIERQKNIEGLRSVQVLTIDGDTVTIRGGATCHIYIDHN